MPNCNAKFKFDLCLEIRGDTILSTQDLGFQFENLGLLLSSFG